MTATIRLAALADVESLAQLKVDWSQLSTEPKPGQVEALTRELSAWIADSESCLCAVAETEEDLVGMAWLILQQRVPDINNLRRWTGDIQSVYVRPGHRGHGVGRKMLEKLIAEFEFRDIPTLTVSSNNSARRLYKDLGFRSSDLNLTLDSEHLRRANLLIDPASGPG